MAARLTATVHGRVQGVGFRYFVRQHAQRLGLKATATNMPDGTVEIVADGDRTAIEQLMDVVRSDEAPGYVARVDMSWSGQELHHGSDADHHDHRTQRGG